MTRSPRNPAKTPLHLLDRDPSPAKSRDRLATSPRPPPQRVRTHVFGQVTVLEVSGRLGDVAEDLDLAIQLALADEPRGVACDLTGVLEGAEPDTVELLATAGRHVRDWPGIPVAVACPDVQVRAALKADPLGRHLIVTSSMLQALSAVLATPGPSVKKLRLSPHPTAPRASRDFVTRALLGWHLGGVTHSVCLVASELVTNSTVHAGTDIDVSIAWNLGTLRLTVRDRSPDLPRQLGSPLDRHMRGLVIATGLSRAFGVLPATDGGKVVWAVFDVPSGRRSTRKPGSEPAVATPKPPPPIEGTVPDSARPHTATVVSPHDTPSRSENPSHRYADSSNYLG